MELAGSERRRLEIFKKKLKAPLFEHLSGFAKRVELPAWSTAALEVVVLGSAHEACRRLLAGGDVDVAWMRRALPHLACKAVLPELFDGPGHVAGGYRVAGPADPWLVDIYSQPHVVLESGAVYKDLNPKDAVPALELESGELVSEVQPVLAVAAASVGIAVAR